MNLILNFRFFFLGHVYFCGLINAKLIFLERQSCYYSIHIFLKGIF